MQGKILKALPAVTNKEFPHTLLVGNGINRLFDDDGSWADIISTQAARHGVVYDKQHFDGMPYTMQIVAATKDTVDKSMKNICKDILELRTTDSKKQLCREILNLPFSNIITPNYTYELERSVSDKKSFRNSCTVPKLNSRNDMMLHKYIPVNCGTEEKFIWHIHGQASSPNSVIMGHYFYGKLLAQIQNYIPTFMRRYQGCCRHNQDYIPRSWVDYFLAGDVYMLGFGMDLCEIDLWWLACCKKRHFPESRIYFFEPAENISPQKRLLMQTYGIEIPEFHVYGDDYAEFYREAMRKMKHTVVCFNLSKKSSERLDF